MPRAVNVDVTDWESICIIRNSDPANIDRPGAYIITTTYKLAGGDVVLRREREVASGRLSAARQTALANLDADVLARIRGAEAV